ncbi:MAG: site-2 protease family protein [Geitlerinemataceae cyanobacterium]
MNGSFRVGSLFGIPFFINQSWFLILALVTLNYATRFLSLGGILPWIMGLFLALLLFASVLAHELGHSVVAQRQGIEVQSITLFLFGGLASLDRESKTPSQAFWVAIAGPVVSLMLFGVFTALQTLPVVDPFPAVFQLLASINLVLALFNLIPGLPLDGGNVLKAIVWKVTGNPYKGVVFASRVGQAIGWSAIGLGVLMLFANTGGFWTILIGWFLLQNAGRSAQSATLQQKLSDLTAKDAVTPNSPIVPADLSLREFANTFIIGQKEWRQFLVTEGDGKLLGAIVADDLRHVSTSEWPTVSVRELTKPVESTTTVRSNQSLLEVVNLLEEKKLTELPVVAENGAIVGILEKASVIRLLQNEAQTNPA